MSGLLGKIPKLTLKLPTSLSKAGKSMSECPLELSFALCEDNSWRKLKEEQVEGIKTEESEFKAGNCAKMENFNIFEKGDEEKSEKDDNMEVTCSVSVDGQEKQEFSFTLYDLDAKEKVSKQDMEKIVVRSICEALGKTLKLPPSGSRTIKVKLAISPDSSKDVDTRELSDEWKNQTVQQQQQQPEKSSPCKAQDYDSSKSGNTVSTYLLSSTTEKKPPPIVQNACECTSPSIAANLATRETKHLMSPKFRSIRHSRLVSLQKQDHPSYRNNPKDHRKKLFEENIPENRGLHPDLTRAAGDVHEPNHNNRDHVPESRERRNHYLDLAGVENDASNLNSMSHKMAANASYMDSGLMCPYRILDRTHICSSKPSRLRTGQDPLTKKSPIGNHPKLNIGGNSQAEAAQGPKALNVQDDLLNLNLDLCDIIPDAKFDWEKISHRRSKSHDMHFTGMPPAMAHSPKVRQRHAQNLVSAAAAMESQKNLCGGVVGGSPVHNFRMRHRDKDRQRAMQQVANWIAREHSQEKVENETHFLTGGFVKSPELAEKHEHHHHIHEHVHHHYHHFVDF